MVTTHEVTRGMEEVMVIIEGVVIEIKIMTALGVGHLTDR